jgi:thioredoxin 1
MNRTLYRVLIVVAVAAAVVAVIAAKSRDTSEQKQTAPPEEMQSASSEVQPMAEVAATGAMLETEEVKLPMLLELGSDTCIPCRRMQPILAELRSEYAGQLNVEFIDIRKDTGTAARYRVRVMPTQIFLNAEGKVLSRHEGFYPKADILAKWAELGVELKPVK